VVVVVVIAVFPTFVVREGGAETCEITFSTSGLLGVASTAGPKSSAFICTSPVSGEDCVTEKT